MENKGELKNLGTIDPKLSNTLMFDALGTTVALHNPFEALKGDEQKLYLLSETQFSPEAVKELPSLIHALGLESEYKALLSELAPQNLPAKRQYYVLCDKLAEKYCQKNHDNEQLMRKSAIMKIYHLVDPEIFPKVLDYSRTHFGQPLRLVLLTNANPLMKEVYTQMVKKHGVEVLVAPNKFFENLRKEEPELYRKIAAYYNSQTSNLGLLDDQKKNIDAAQSAGSKFVLYDKDGQPINPDTPEGRKELNAKAEQLVELLNGHGEPLSADNGPKIS